MGIDPIPLSELTDADLSFLRRARSRRCHGLSRGEGREGSNAKGANNGTLPLLSAMCGERSVELRTPHGRGTRGQAPACPLLKKYFIHSLRRTLYSLLTKSPASPYPSSPSAIARVLLQQGLHTFCEGPRVLCRLVLPDQAGRYVLRYQSG